MTVYCQDCPERFDSLMGNDVAKEREMYLEHKSRFHGESDPVLHSFFRWEVKDRVPASWGHRQ